MSLLHVAAWRATAAPDDAVLCARCDSRGAIERDAPCPTCGGVGRLRRLIIPVSVLSVADLWPPPASEFQRLAVLVAEHGKEKVILRGVTDLGRPLVTATSVERFARAGHVQFVESGRRWSP